MARILVIDDQAAIRQTVRRVLEPLGHDIVEAEDAQAGLAHVARGGVDLIVTDIFMPGEDGIVLLRRLRNEFPGMRVIAMSGGGFGGRVDLLQDAALLGAARTLAKPFQPDELRDAVRDVLGA